MEMNIIKEFIVFKFTDQIAFLTVAFSLIGFTVFLANAAVLHPFDGAVTAVVFAMFARWAVMYMWERIIGQPKLI